jgi:hypothetical protein
MRSAFPFDTHAYVKKLVAAGVSEQQAEVQAEALADIALANLATKDDVRTIKDDLRTMEERLLAKIEAVRLEFKAELSERMRQQMVWFLAVQIALFGTAIALIKLF